MLIHISDFLIPMDDKPPDTFLRKQIFLPVLDTQNAT